MSNYQFVRRTPPKKILRNFAIFIAAILVIWLVVPRVHGAIMRTIDERRTRNEILYDFDFIMDILVDNFPYFPMIYRRTGIDMPAQIPALRARLADTSYPAKTVDEFEQFLWEFLRQADSIGHLSVNRGYASMRPVSSEENLHTEIIVEGRIAYLRVNHMFVHGSRSGNAVMDTCRAIVDPFLQEIGGFEHLILDIRGNSGGIGGYFEQLVMSPLAVTHNVGGFPTLVTRGSLHAIVHHFMRDGSHNSNNLDMIRWRGAGTFRNISDRLEADHVGFFDSINFGPMPEYIVNDLQMTSYHFMESLSIPSITRISPFDGKVWLLVDERTASAAQRVATLAQDSGFATLVGNTTRGVVGFGLFVTLPNSRIMVRYDPTFMTDRRGRPLEYGTIPCYFNREGMDALETVLAMIEELSY